MRNVLGIWSTKTNTLTSGTERNNQCPMSMSLQLNKTIRFCKYTKLWNYILLLVLTQSNNNTSHNTASQRRQRYVCLHWHITHWHIDCLVSVCTLTKKLIPPKCHCITHTLLMCFRHLDSLESLTKYNTLTFGEKTTAVYQKTLQAKGDFSKHVPVTRYKPTRLTVAYFCIWL